MASGIVLYVSFHSGAEYISCKIAWNIIYDHKFCYEENQTNDIFLNSFLKKTLDFVNA